MADELSSVKLAASPAPPAPPAPPSVSAVSADPSVGRTLARLARQVELGAASADLSLSQYRVLVILDSGQEAASTLADKLAVSRPSITGVVDGLVGRGLVCREGAEGDRRRINLELTADGAHTLGLAEAQIQHRLEAVAAHMPDGPSAAFAAFGPWRAALDAYRRARHVDR